MIAAAEHFRAPDFVIARRVGRGRNSHWRVRERLFDYQGRHRKANAL